MRTLTCLLVAVMLLGFTACTQKETTDTKTNNATPKTNKPTASKKTEQAAGIINWVDIKDLEKQMKKEPRKVVVDLYTDWCGWCKRMDKNTFQHPEIAKYINEHFYAVKFDAETKDDIQFKGETFKWQPGSRKGTNQLTYKLILGDNPKSNRIGYPTIAFLDEKLNRIDAYSGYKDASKFDGLMRFVKEGHYATMSLGDFQQSYTSPIPASSPFGKKPTRKTITPPQKKVQEGTGQKSGTP